MPSGGRNVPGSNSRIAELIPDFHAARAALRPRGPPFSSDAFLPHGLTCPRILDSVKPLVRALARATAAVLVWTGGVSALEGTEAGFLAPAAGEALAAGARHEIRWRS